MVSRVVRRMVSCIVFLYSALCSVLGCCLGAFAAKGVIVKCGLYRMLPKSACCVASLSTPAVLALFLMVLHNFIFFWIGGRTDGRTVYLSICLPACLSVYLSVVYVFVYLFAYLSLFLYNPSLASVFLGCAADG